jgi:nitrate reductase gamma subunit
MYVLHINRNAFAHVYRRYAVPFEWYDKNTANRRGAWVSYTDFSRHISIYYVVFRFLRRFVATRVAYSNRSSDTTRLCNGRVR